MPDWKISYFFSKEFLGSKFMLWSLFWVNLLGTLYGYEWYGNQLIYTAINMSPWFLPFVPDSPTASLFFTLFLVYLLNDRKREQQHIVNKVSLLRGFVEAFAVVTSFKYGIWAVTMIMAGAYQGDTLVWQDWMLTISHLGMAAEVILYFQWYRYRLGAVLLVAYWALLNDFMDYAYGVYPWLPEVLMDDLPTIQWFTISLSLISVAVALGLILVRKRRF